MLSFRKSAVYALWQQTDRQTNRQTSSLRLQSHQTRTDIE